MKKIICLVGESGSGKTTVVEVLRGEGYASVSLSDEVRAYMKEMGYQTFTREEMQVLANQAREEHREPGYFAQRLIEKGTLDEHQFLAVDGVRNPAEISVIREALGPSGEISVWAVHANQEIRYKRILERRDPSDPLSFEEFLANEARETGVDGNEFSQQNLSCLEGADVKIVNNETSEQLREAVLKLLAERGFGPEGKTFLPGKERF